MNLRLRLKRKALKKAVQIKETISSYIQPFTEMPSVNHMGNESEDRISAHDLFSHYTADIIKEDIIFIR